MRGILLWLIGIPIPIHHPPVALRRASLVLSGSFPTSAVPDLGSQTNET